MSKNYIPLYRKYRPQTIEELVGQTHLKQALSNAINLNKISHAYLFTGPRGTGKTSTARIFAKSLNCINGPTIKPCGKCPSCTDIANSIPIDVVEIDAASNRKVEDAQNILEKIQYAPVNGKYKIYIIDEVHMLTSTAFNALLKTLEEPPANVVFILATTESHKVLDTIKSRCQRFDFRRIQTDDISKHLRFIADKETINIKDNALYAIANNSAGGMRDSIALLDQVSILGETKTIEEDDINNLLGRLSFEILHEISEYIINSDSIKVISLLDKIYNSGNEPIQILTNLMEYFRNLLIVKNCDSKSAIEFTSLNKDQIKKLNTQKELLETHQIVSLIDKTANYIKEVKMTTNQHMWLEVALIDLSNLTNNTKLAELQTRLQALESGTPTIAKAQITQAPTPISKTTTIEVQSHKPIEKPAEQIIKNEPKQEHAQSHKHENKSEETVIPMPKPQIIDKSSDISTLWATLLSNIKSPSTIAILRLANPVKISAEEVIITFKQEMFVKQASEGTKKTAIIEAANAMFNQQNSKVTIRIPMDSDVEIAKTTTTVIQKQEVPKQEKKNLTPEKTNISKEEIETVEEVKKEEKKLASTPLDEDKKQTPDKYESDQSKMIKDLFDGKYIN